MLDLQIIRYAVKVILGCVFLCPLLILSIYLLGVSAYHWEDKNHIRSTYKAFGPGWAIWLGITLLYIWVVV